MGNTCSRHNGHSRGGRGVGGDSGVERSWDGEVAVVKKEVGEGDRREDEEGEETEEGEEEEPGGEDEGAGEKVARSGGEKRSTAGSVQRVLEDTSGDREEEGIRSERVQGGR